MRIFMCRAGVMSGMNKIPDTYAKENAQIYL